MNTLAQDDKTAPVGGVHRGVWIGGALMGATIVALATALVVKGHDASAPTPLASVATVPGTASPTSPMSTTPANASTAPPQNESLLAAQAANGGGGVNNGARVAATTSATGQASPAPVTSSVENGQAPAANPGVDPSVAGGGPSVSDGVPTRVAAAPVCADCGVVTSYDMVKVQGATNGVGAVAGGVGGALVGSQIAGRNNHTVGGLVGAIGGGLLGNTIEKHARTVTEYDVHVRMNDGSYRTVRQGRIPAVGERVEVRGHALHALPTAHRAAPQA